MSLGYALVHPVLVEATASANPWRASFDDGVDVVASVFGAGDLRPYADAFQAAVQEQFDEVGAQFAALVEPGGPLEMLRALGEGLDEDLDVAALVRAAGELLCDLDPTVAAGFVSGIVDDIAAALPVLSPADLLPRIADLVDAVLGVLEAPLLSGRDDLEAHRAYRAAAVIRAQIAPLLDRLGDLLAGVDVAAFLRGFLTDAVGAADLDVAPIRRLGCLLSEQIAPIVDGIFGCAAAFRLDVDVGDGPQGMPEPVTLADDAHPAPFPVNGSAVDSALWAIDLATNLISLAGTIANIAVTGNPVRGLRLFHFFADLLLPVWIAFRTLARAVRWDFINADRFSRFLFSDLGDFCVQFFLRFFGSFSDAFAFSNWISNVGLTLMKYHLLTLQPRSIYLYARSLWYVQTWKAAGRPADPGVPVHRYVWLAYTPVMFVGFILGLFYGGLLTKYVSVRRVWLPITVGGILGLAMMWLALPIYGVSFSSITWPPGTGMFIGGTAVVLLLIGVLQFSQVAEFETNTGGQVALWLLFAVLLVLVVVGAALAGTDTTQRLNDGMTGFILFGPGAALVAGTLPQLLWWYVLAEGADLDDVFDALDPATSPYLLPFRSDEDWMCGQDNQGFWSHQAHDGAGFSEDFNDGNRYSFDLNSGRGSHCLAARSGLVVDLRDDQPTGNPDTANRLEIQHLDWVAGHDPGWDAERTLTYSWYLHVEERGIRATIGQHVRRGHWVALLDDTGNSAMEHLHFSGAGGQNFALANDDPIDLPVVFADGGRVHSLTFPRSGNTEIDGDAPVARSLPVDAGSTGHTHQTLLRAADLGADGTIPASVTLVTTPGTAPSGAHRHELTLTAAQIGDLLEGRDVTAATASADGHTHPLGAAGPQNGWLEVPQGQVQLAAPPSGRLVARAPAPYDLLGEQLFLRVDDRTTEWFTWGAHRPSLVGDLALDRAPVPGARVRLALSPPVDVQTASHLMARAGGAALMADAETSGAPIAIRALPVLVLETRRRGTSASLAVTAAPPGLEVGATADGSGDVADLSLSVAALRARITDELTQASGIPTAAVSGTGSTRTFTVNGNPVTDVTGSTPRIATVLGAALSGGSVSDRNHLPLTAGRLRLAAGVDALDVPIVAAPARVVITDRVAARLTGAELVAEALFVTVRDDVQRVSFDAADDSPEGVAGRIANAAEGVRAWAEGPGVVIETVAAGADVSLSLSKGGATFPDVTGGAAPPLAGAVVLADSTSVTLDEIAALVDRARSEAVHPTLALTVGGSGGTIRLEATAGTGTQVAVEGPRDLMAALGVFAASPADRTTRREGDGAVELTGLPGTVDLPTGGWLDITVGGDTARVHLAAEPARAELLLRDLTAAGGTLGLEVNGSAVTVALAADDVASRHAVAARIAATTADVTVRTAYRYAVEWGLHGEVPGGTLALSVAAGATGLLAAGFTAAAIASQGRAQHVDVTAAAELDRVADRHGTVVRAFSAAVVDAGTLSERVEVSSADGQGLGVVAFGRDPFGLIPPLVPPTPPATRTISGATHDLGAASVAYDVEAAATVTTVEFDAAPAHLHGSLGTGPIRLPDDPVLGVVTTDPAGASRRLDVHLRGRSTMTEVAWCLQGDAPHVVAWTSAGGTQLNVDTPGGGRGWRLRLEGRAVLVALGFDAARIDDAGGIDAAGRGNVADGAAVTLAEIAEVFDTVGGLATRDPSDVYTADVSGTTLTVASLQGAVALRSDPPPIAAALAPATSGDAVTVNGASFALDSGWLFVDVGADTLGAALLWGRRAWVESDPVSDADVAAFTGDVRLTIDGAAGGSVAVTPATTTVAALVDLLTLAAPTAWVGWIRRADGTRVLRVESRTRGAASSVTVTLPSPALGFGTAVTSAPASGPGSGGGSVDDLGGVEPAELASLLVGGRGTTAAPQDAIDASAATGLLRFVARGGQGVALTVVDAPDGLTPVAVPLRPDVAEFAYPAPLDTGPDATELTVTPPAGGAGARTVRAVLRATPARLGPMTLPANLPDLDGLTLRLTADGTTATVTFAGIASPADVIAQIQRGMDWRVRASVLPGPPDRLLVETVLEGTSAALSAVTDPTVSTAVTVLGAPAPATAAGGGDTANVRSVPAADLAAVVDRGLLGGDPAADTSSQLALEVQQGSVTTAFGATAGLEFRGRESNRSGCASSITVLPASGSAGSIAAALAAGPAALNLDRSLARGPAVRAAVVLPPFADAAGAPVERALSGSLGILLDDHGAGADLAPATQVTIDFDGSFSAAAAAAVLDEALSDRGVGRAAAYPDGTIVVETNTDGLAGRVTVPAPGAPGDAAVLDALGLDAAAPLDERGWPRNGFRSALTTARGDASWRFVVPLTGGATATLDHDVTAGQSASDVAAALNARLRDFTGALTPSDGTNRVGLAVTGADGALLLEFFAPGVVFTIAGTPLPPVPGGQRWLGTEPGVDDALELRPTTLLRTFRMVHVLGEGGRETFCDPAAFDPPAGTDDHFPRFDVGWIRPPTDANGAEQPVQRWAPGRWLLAARAAGARADTTTAGLRVPGYAPAGEMIASGGSATGPDGQPIHFAHRVRYWLTLTRDGDVLEPLRVVRVGDEFLTDVVIHPA